MVHGLVPNRPLGLGTSWRGPSAVVRRDDQGEGEMGIARTAWLCRLAAAALPMVLGGQALAQDAWSGGAPVFGSDVQARQQALEAERAERRKTYAPVSYPAFMQGGEKPEIAPEKPPVVYIDKNEEPGSIIIDTAGRKLYYVLPGKQAYAYPISVGRDGFTWTGTERISRVASWPTWTPPPEMRQRQKGLPVTVTGGLINPLGARALYLGSSIYRIHGTNNERSIGRANSSGCFRLTNAHVVHLASIAKVGTKVTVMNNYSGVSEGGAPIASIFSIFGTDEPTPKPKAKAVPKKVKTATTVKKKD